LPAANLRTRRKRAAFPAGKTFDGWDEQAFSIARPTQGSLKTLEWVRNKENPCICGLGPYEGFRVGVPFVGPLPHVLFQRGDAAVGGAAEFSVGQLGEPALDPGSAMNCWSG
jgi:hypothetical protein